MPADWPPTFLTLETVLQIHLRMLAEFGGGDGVRDPLGLASAVAMPEAGFGEQYFHPDVFAMAAAYAFHIAQNRPFVDGNKRTALGAALIFLTINGVPIEDPKGDLYAAMIAITMGQLDKPRFARLLERLSDGREA